MAKKTSRPPFDRLRVNGGEIKKIEEFPFVLSVSKHVFRFLSNL